MSQVKVADVAKRLVAPALSLVAHGGVLGLALGLVYLPVQSGAEREGLLELVWDSSGDIAPPAANRASAPLTQSSTVQTPDSSESEPATAPAAAGGDESFPSPRNGRSGLRPDRAMRLKPPPSRSITGNADSPSLQPAPPTQPGPAAPEAAATDGLPALAHSYGAETAPDASPSVFELAVLKHLGQSISGRRWLLSGLADQAETVLDLELDANGNLAGLTIDEGGSGGRLGQVLADVAELAAPYPRPPGRQRAIIGIAIRPAGGLDRGIVMSLTGHARQGDLRRPGQTSGIQ